MNTDNKMLLSLAKNDFKAKYAGSALGAVWAFISPVITILIYFLNTERSCYIMSKIPSRCN